MSEIQTLTEKELEEEKTKYTRKINSPIYEPKGTKPSIKELIDTTKRDELLKEIDGDKDLPNDLRDFLKSSAERHVSFNFTNIAEYYSHLPIEFKHHFENSGLVIVDYDNAIRNGFVAYQKEVDIERIDYLENYITEEKMIQNRDEISIKKQKRAEEELEFLKNKKNQEDFCSSYISDEEW